MWKQRSMVDWLQEGDMNTKYFHAKASHRKRVNLVKKIQTLNGDWVSKENDI